MYGLSVEFLTINHGKEVLMQEQKDRGVVWFNTVFYPKRKTARAMRYEDGVLVRMKEDEVRLFTPWGPRYSWKERGIAIRDADKEAQVIEHLSEMLREWQKNMPEKRFSWLFLGADLYGTKVNALPKEVVSDYFGNVQALILANIPMAEFRLWSSFDAEAETYRELVRADFRKYVDANLLTRAENTARGLRTGGDPKVYLVERFAEAMLIEERFRPVKISCVGRHKDAKVDHELPVLYFLPEELHAPWL